MSRFYGSLCKFGLFEELHSKPAKSNTRKEILAISGQKLNKVVDEYQK